MITQLAAEAATAPTPWAQVGAADKVGVLKDYVRVHAHDSGALLPEASGEGAPRDTGCKLYVALIEM